MIEDGGPPLVASCTLSVGRFLGLRAAAKFGCSIIVRSILLFRGVFHLLEKDFGVIGEREPCRARLLSSKQPTAMALP